MVSPKNGSFDPLYHTGQIMTPTPQGDLGDNA